MPLGIIMVEQDKISSCRTLKRKEKTMPIVSLDKFPEFQKYKELKGVFVGGCVSRGEGSRFRAYAHAHTHKGYPHHGWVCVLSPKRLFVKDTQKASRTMWHEIAHIITGHGHDDVWRNKMKELGQPIPSHYKKFNTRNWRGRK